VFANNTTTKAGGGPVLIFEHVDGLTVSGNSQPVTSGWLVSISDSTAVNSSEPDGSLERAVAILGLLVVALTAIAIQLRRRAWAHPFRSTG
jgi:hypothetical protein